MSEYIHPYDLPDGDEQRSLHLGRYRCAAGQIKGMVVANAACSTNYGSEILAKYGRLVIGFDRNKNAIERARKDGRFNIIERDLQNETFEGFTTLVCLETFEHLERPWDFLKNIHSTVKELVLSVPCIPTKHFNEWHLHDFTTDEVLSGLASHGWQVVTTTFQDESPLPKPTYLIVYATR